MPKGIRETQVFSDRWATLPFALKKRVALFGKVALSPAFELAFRAWRMSGWRPFLTRPLSEVELERYGGVEELHAEFEDVGKEIAKLMMRSALGRFIEDYRLLQRVFGKGEDVRPEDERRFRILNSYERLLLENGTPPTLAELKKSAGAREWEVRQFDREAGECALPFSDHLSRQKLMSWLRRLCPDPGKIKQVTVIEGLKEFPRARIQTFDIPIDLFCHVVVHRTDGTGEVAACDLDRSFGKRAFRLERQLVSKSVPDGGESGVNFEIDERGSVDQFCSESDRILSAAYIDSDPEVGGSLLRAPAPTLGDIKDEVPAFSTFARRLEKDCVERFVESLRKTLADI